MPLYEYECPDGHRTEQVREVKNRDIPEPCFEITDRGPNSASYCGKTLKRVLSVPAPLPNTPERPGRGRHG